MLIRMVSKQAVSYSRTWSAKIRRQPQRPDWALAVSTASRSDLGCRPVPLIR